MKAIREMLCTRCQEVIRRGEEIVAWEDPETGELGNVHFPRCANAGPGRAGDRRNPLEDEWDHGPAARKPSTNGTGVSPLVLEQAKQELADNLKGSVERLVLQNGKAIEEAEQALAKKVGSHARNAYRQVEEKLLALAEKVRPVVVQVRQGDGEPRPLPPGVYHEAFPEVLKLVGMGMDVLCWGPAGVGKTKLVQQVAAALGRPFGYVGGSGGVTERSFTGTSIPNLSTGEDVFVDTPFIRLVEGGGVFLVDEGDGMDPNVWLCLNSVLANGILSLPLRRKQPVAHRHPNFVLVVASNTVGGGADRDYTARAKLDLSTLDRFAGCMVEVGYSPAVEEALCPEPNLRRVLMDWRQKIQEAGLGRILSTRFVEKAYRFAGAGESLEEIAARLTRKSGWSRDEAVVVLGEKMTQEIYGGAT